MREASCIKRQKDRDKRKKKKKDKKKGTRGNRINRGNIREYFKIGFYNFPKIKDSISITRIRSYKNGTG